MHCITLVALLCSTRATLGQGPSFDDCQKEYAKTPDRWGAVNCFYRVARATRRIPQGLTLIHDLIQRRPEDQKLRLIRIYFEPDSQEANKLALYKDVLTAFQERGDLEGQLRTLDSLWGFYKRKGRLSEAEQTLQKMENLVEKSDNFDYRARVAVVKARHAFELERDFARARDILIEHEDILAASESYRLQQRFLHLMGRSHFELGLPDAAYYYFRREAELARTNQEHRDESLALYNIVIALRDRVEESSDPADRERAIQEARKILARGRMLDFAEPVVAAVTALGDLLRNDQSLALYEECAQITQGSPSLINEYRLCRLKLATYWASRDPDLAYSILAQTMKDMPSVEDPLQATYDIMNEIRVPWGAQDFEKAWRFSTEALDAIENLRELQGRTDGRARSFSAWTATYTWLVGRLLKCYRKGGSTQALERAFEVSERMRARMLLDILETRTLDLPESEMAQAKRAELRESLARKSELLREIRLGLITETGQAAKAKRELTTLVETERKLRAQLSEMTGRFTNLKRATFSTLAEVQGRLGPHEAFLVFQLAPDESPFEAFAGGSWILVITKSSAHAYQLEPSREVSQRLSMLSGLMETGASGADLLSRVHQDLLSRALSQLPPEVTDLIVIPDKILHRIPLAALVPEGQTAPLGTKYRVTRVPSATLWLQKWRDVPAENGTEIPALVLADPELGASDSVASSRAFTTANILTDSRLGPVALDRLPFAQQEGWSLRRHLGPKTEILSGPEATERALKRSSLDRFGILHFAAHALADEKRPDHSGVVLAPDLTDPGMASESGLEDGILHFHEIVELGFSGRAVVLSTCHSARGQILRGEGVFDLARAFFEGGARAVVGSLWRLEDRATARFFDDFYRHLARGTSLSGALHLTQRDQIARGAPASAWAGIVVIGDGSLVPFPNRGGRHHPGWAIAVALILLAVAAGVASRRTG